MSDNKRDDSAYEAAMRQLAESGPRPGSLWRHRNGTLYRVLCGCVVEATLTPAVAYHEADLPYHSATVWVRPLTEFTDGRFVHEIPRQQTRRTGAFVELVDCVQCGRLYPRADLLKGETLCVECRGKVK